MAVLTSPVHSPLAAVQGPAHPIAEPDGLRHHLPRRQSLSVSELSARLYAAYEVVGGSVRLAGCALEPRPIVHLKAEVRASGAPTTTPLELFVGDDGQPLADGLVAELGIDDCVGATKPPRFASATLSRLVDQARWMFAERCREIGQELEIESVEAEIIWCRFAEGKLRFTIADRSSDLPFAQWAERLQPPPFVCPETGVSTFRIAATDDGRIVAAEEIFTCEQTNRRMLRRETVVCSVTGQRIAAELAEQCPVTGEHVLRDRMNVCPVCRASVSPSAIEHEHCRACATIAPVKKSDPRMCLVLGEHPGLDRWRRWQLAETPQAYVLEAHSLMQRLLVVVDKQSLEMRRLARRGRFQSAWIDVPPESWREWLQ